MEEIELFEWTYDNLTDKKLFAWKRPLACPNCQNEDGGIAPIVWKNPIGEYVDCENGGGDIDFYYCGGSIKPNPAPSWKCCICGQEYYSKKKYPKIDDNMFCLYILRSGGPIGTESSIRVAFDSKTNNLKIWFRYGEEENPVIITPDIRDLFSCHKIEQYMSMKFYDRSSFHASFWITMLWKGCFRHYPVYRDYFSQNNRLRTLFEVLFEDDKL